ncbi:hypothetical protein LWI28_013369 [Acer negundo]|uniref:Glucosamine inositolphosphorylceramide transferase 1 N-terminal domain-containing protein n=1 Tax=Acer negundo TaxID=4023 RepID=A0AAD5IA33_ACENE|nr:hypothetical protein LWI28_013369 [Acer negundo]
MGSGQVIGGGGPVAGGGSGCNGSGGANCTTGSSSSCWWWCHQWRHHGHNQNYNQGRRLMLSSGFVFFVGCFVLYCLIGWFYGWLLFMKPYVSTQTPSIGCREDSEGSWSIGIFYGDSPFSLKPIENMNVWRDHSAAWPVSNPILSCASVSQSGFPSNFVADPFMYAQICYGKRRSHQYMSDVVVATTVGAIVVRGIRRSTKGGMKRSCGDSDDGRCKAVRGELNMG